MSSQLLVGHGCAAAANTIWGLMAPIAKTAMMGGLITPMLLTDLRIFGAALLFWIASFFAPREKVTKGDLIRLFFASSLCHYFQSGQLRLRCRAHHPRQRHDSGVHHAALGNGAGCCHSQRPHYG